MCIHKYYIFHAHSNHPFVSHTGPYFPSYRTHHTDNTSDSYLHTNNFLSCAITSSMAFPHITAVRVLKRISRTLLICLSSVSKPARLGGGEFGEMSGICAPKNSLGLSGSVGLIGLLRNRSGSTTTCVATTYLAGLGVVRG